MTNIHQSPINAKSAKSELDYNRSARKWTVACNGSLAEFPADKQGKTQAQLYTLEQDRPDIHSEIKAMAENRPDLLKSGEIVRGGLIVASGGVQLLHLNHYRVKGNNPGGSYLVSIFPFSGIHCQCVHWANGNAKHYFGFPRRTYPPWIDPWGPLCKHGAAVILGLAISPIEPCQICQGKSYLGLVTVQAGYQSCIPCETCHATGAQPAREFIGYADYEQAEIR